MTTPILLRTSLLTVLFTGAAALSAQTPAAKAPVHHATATAHTAVAGGSCSKDIPVLSPKIPALPEGLPCARPLYTVTTTPAIKLEYVSPLEGAGLRETLGVEPATFSLSYIDTKVGTGELAQPHKWYSIQYTGYLTDGTKFDSSFDHGGEPISINYGQHMVIPGWDTGFDGMRVGGKRRLFIPYQLAYGPQGHAPIPAKAELVFDVELVAQSDTKPATKTPPAGARPPMGGRPMPPGRPGAPGAPGAPANVTAPPPPAKPATPPATAPATK